MDKERPTDLKKFELTPKGNAEIVNTPLINKRRILIGRSLNCDIVVYDSLVSSIHAVLEVTSQKIRIYDLNSKNGTFVNGEKVVSSEIKLGDEISLANIKFNFNEQSKERIEPPVLDMLKAGVPPVIQSKKTSRKEVSELLEKGREKVLPSRPVGFKDDDEVPSIIYPLAADPKAEFSEYIFEDVEKLYPIFKYNFDFRCVEVIIQQDDKIYSVDYLPIKTGTYYLQGFLKEENCIEFPYLKKEDKFPFITVQASDVSVSPPLGYETLYFSDEKRQTGKDEIHLLSPQDIIRFKKGPSSIFVRHTDSPPKVAGSPFLRRDPLFWKYFTGVMLAVLAFLLLMIFYPVNEEKEKEEIPKTIRTIIYKPKVKIEKAKLTASKNKAVVKTKKAKKIPQKTPEPKKIVKPTPKKPTPPVKKPVVKLKDVPKIPKNAKPVGQKNKQVVKKIKRAKNPGPPQKTSGKKLRTRGASKKIGGQKTTKTAQSSRKAQVNSRSRGHVDAYKSANLKSTISGLMAKGGRVKGASVKSSTASSSTFGFSGTKSGGQALGDLKRASVGKNLGSLTGATTGKIDTSKGAEGLVNKRTVYTAGLPSNTVVLGSMDPDIIRRILRENTPQFRFCYQRELDRANKEFSGVVNLAFTIGASGFVTKAGVVKGSKLPAQVKRCVLNVLRGIKFPEPLGGGRVEVRQPINFYTNLR